MKRPVQLTRQTVGILIDDLFVLRFLAFVQQLKTQGYIEVFPNSFRNFQRTFSAEWWNFVKNEKTFISV